MKLLFTVLLFLCPVFCCSVQAQTTSSEEKTLAELQAEVEALKKKTSTWDKIVPYLPKISGFMQFCYNYSETKDESNFALKRVRVSLAGDFFKKKLDYRLQVEFTNTPKIVDAYINYKPFNQLNIRAGQFKIPFAIENTGYTPPTKFEFIEYPLALKNLMTLDEPIYFNGEKVATHKSSGRDMGLMLYGGFFQREGYSILNYDLAVFNGAGINTTDTNKSKDICARLSIVPIEGLQFTSSYYWGEYSDKDHKVNHLRRVRYSAGACYDKGPWVVRGEWMGGETGALESDGWYAMGGYRVLKSLLLVARYDTFKRNSHLADTRQTNYTAGLVWRPLKFLCWHLNYTYEDYKAVGKPCGSGVSVMVAGIF